MLRDEPSVVIGFTYTDEDGASYSAESELVEFREFGDTYPSLMMQQFYHFMKQIGYEPGGTLFFDIGITDDEYDAIIKFLNEYRERNNDLYRE